MPNTVLTFNVSDRQARAAFSRLKREISELDNEFRDTRSEAQDAGKAIDRLGDHSRATARDIDRLGDEAQQSAAQIVELDTAARRNNATWRDRDSRLRDVRGRFIGAGQGTEFWTKSLGDARRLLAGLGAARAAREILEFGTASVRAAEQMAGLLRGLRAIEGSQADARNTATTAGAVNKAFEDRSAFGHQEKQAIEQQAAPNFQEAIAASDAYYNARIEKSKAALAEETTGTEKYNQRQVEIFDLQRQRLQAQGQLETQTQGLREQLKQQRIDAANATSTAEVEGFKAATAAAKVYADQLQRQINARLAFQRQIDAIPRISSPDAQSGRFTSQLREHFAETEQQGRSLLTVMREIASMTFDRFDLDARIPDPGVRQDAIDQRIAAQARGAQTLETIRQDAAEQGRQFVERLRLRETRDLQKNLNEQARYYRQFANSVSNLLTGVVTGRIRGFEAIAKAFLANSLKIAARAFIEYQLQKRLDDTLTASKIANIQKVAAAQQASAAGAAGIGNLPVPGIPNIGSLGSSLTGGGAALGVSALLFPQEIKNLTAGISDTIAGLISNVASAPDKAFAPQQVFLKIGDGEVRDITDLQEEMRQEARI